MMVPRRSSLLMALYYRTGTWREFKCAKQHLSEREQILWRELTVSNRYLVVRTELCKLRVQASVQVLVLYRK